MSLTDADLDQLRARMEQLDALARAEDEGAPELSRLTAEAFPRVRSDSDWDDYHRVRSEYDRRAAEEFDLGQ